MSPLIRLLSIGDGEVVLATVPAVVPINIDHNEHVELVRRVLARDSEAMSRFVGYVLPVVHTRVAKALLADPYGNARNRDIRHEIEDMTQEVMAWLFEGEGKVLAAWSPHKGLSLKNFVGLVARRRVTALLVARKSNPWYDQPVDDQILGRSLGPFMPNVEGAVAAKQAWSAALRRTDDEVSVMGSRLLALFFGKGCSNADVRAETGLSEAAVYKWRSRLGARFRNHLRIVLREEGDVWATNAEDP